KRSYSSASVLLIMNRGVSVFLRALDALKVYFKSSATFFGENPFTLPAGPGICWGICLLERGRGSMLGLGTKSSDIFKLKSRHLLCNRDSGGGLCKLMNNTTRSTLTFSPFFSLSSLSSD